MELFIATPPGQGAPSPFIPAHMAYRIGSGPRLLGIRMSKPHQGGLMMADCRDFDGQGDPACCCRQIAGECKRQGFRGMVCDFEGPPVGCLPRLVEQLSRQVTLYVPEAFASFSHTARVLIPSALTTGTLERRLRTAADRYGVERLTLAVEWLREDFLLPASGQGQPITQGALEEQLRRLEPAVFFDRGLCAHYYTYLAGGQAHFVLFDTPRSLREKLAVAERLGVTSALLPPEAGEYAAQIME